MVQKLQKVIHRQVYDLLGYNGRVPLHILAQDTCSEVARLVGNQLAKKLPKSKVLIAKGKVKKRHHDLILLEYHCQVDIIDPTVWQFQKHKKSIWVDSTKTVTKALATLTILYGGKWKISESVKAFRPAEVHELTNALKETIYENKKLFKQSL